LANSLLAFDNRSLVEAELLEKQFGRDWIFRTTGMPCHPMYSASKILWWKNHQPQVFKNSAYFLCYEDLILYWLGAEPVTSYSSAARTMLFDIGAKAWSEPLLNACGLVQNQLGQPMPSGSPAGIMSASLADELGMRGRPLLVVGGHDQACGALGAGVVEPGYLLDSTGTFEILFLAFEQLKKYPEFLENNFSIYPHVCSNRFATFGMIPTAGAALRWFRDQFGQDDLAKARANNLDVYDLITNQFSSEPSNLLLVPHFSGSGTPWMNPRAMGGMYGLSLDTTRYEFGQAILEGLTFEMRTNVDLLERLTGELGEIHCIGGGSRSHYWLQLKADITGKQLFASPISDVAPLGAAMLAGLSGAWSCQSDALNAFALKPQIFTPNPLRQAAYAEKYDKYSRFRQQLLELAG
jgi:xylulokinase